MLWKYSSTIVIVKQFNLKLNSWLKLKKLNDFFLKTLFYNSIQTSILYIYRQGWGKSLYYKKKFLIPIYLVVISTKTKLGRYNRYNLPMTRTRVINL